MKRFFAVVFLFVGLFLISVNELGPGIVGLSIGAFIFFKTKKSKKQTDLTAAPTIDKVEVISRTPKNKRGFKYYLVGFVLIGTLLNVFLAITQSKSSDTSNTAKPVIEEVTAEKFDYNPKLEIIKADGAQLVQIQATLTELGIVEIDEIEYDEMLDGGFSYTEEDGYGTEQGYRLTYDDANNIIAYVDEGVLIGVNYAGHTLYRDNQVLYNLADLYISKDEFSAIARQTMSYVESTLVSPKSADFPSPIFSWDQWDISKSDGVIKVSSYVDSSNTFGVELRTNFYLELVDNMVMVYETY